MIDRPLMLNHAETVFRPGEKGIARAALETFGFYVGEITSKVDGKDTIFLVASIDPSTGTGVDNVIYASEVTPVQLRYEEAMKAVYKTDEKLSEAATQYRERMAAHPQIFPHFGFSVPSLQDWEERVARVRDAAKNHPLLAGRIDVAAVFKHEPPHAPNTVTPQTQAFIKTDAFALGFLDFPLFVEIQYSEQEALDHFRPYTSAGQPASA